MNEKMIPELTNYLLRIEDLRGQISRMLAELPVEALNWKPIEGKDDHVTNSIAALTAHLAGAEHFWIAEVVGRQPETRNREAEFTFVATSTADIIQLLERNSQETRGVFSTLSEIDLNGTRLTTGHTVSVRWCILHVIDHTALHLGHMQITFQLWAGGRSLPSPLWFERLPKS